MQRRKDFVFHIIGWEDDRSDWPNCSERLVAIRLERPIESCVGFFTTRPSTLSKQPGSEAFFTDVFGREPVISSKGKKLRPLIR